MSDESERAELEERLAQATIVRDNSQEDFDNAAAELDAFNAAHPEPADGTEAPA